MVFPPVLVSISLINIFLQIRQTLLFLRNRHLAYIAEGREKSHTEKYKDITSDWNYDASCTLTSLPFSDLENFKGSIFVAQSVQI
jgi:hypothetical protein